MGYTYLLHPLIKQDYDEAYQWYEDKKKGLGERFIRAVRKKIEEIALSPETFGSRGNRKFREAEVDVFPYVVVYKINKRKKEIYISSIHHAKKHPRNKYIGAWCVEYLCFAGSEPAHPQGTSTHPAVPTRHTCASLSQDKNAICLIKKIILSSKYKFSDQEKLYFLSFAVVYWIDLFIRNEYKDILLESWKYKFTRDVTE